MKRLFFGIAAIFIAANVNAQSNDVVFDTTKFETLNEVVVSGVRVQKDAPFAVTNIKKTELNDFAKTGQELPFLFAKTPGIIAWSENGIGSGTSYMRIRGAGDSRINVTLDGVALNSPEDQCVFWANMNSYGSLLGSVQIQRGVGTSTNGDGAFGGTVALSSATPSFVPSAEITGSYGSFNTLNFGAKASTGLLWNHIIIDGAYHETHTDGFVHGTQGRSGSYYGGITYVNNNFQLRYKNIGNFERTGQAWNGVTAGSNDLSLMDGSFGIPTGIKTYADMWNVGLGQYNSLYEYLVTDEDGNFVKDENGNGIFHMTPRFKWILGLSLVLLFLTGVLIYPVYMDALVVEVWQLAIWCVCAILSFYAVVKRSLATVILNYILFFLPLLIFHKENTKEYYYSYKLLLYYHSH